MVENSASRGHRLPSPSLSRRIRHGVAGLPMLALAACAVYQYEPTPTPTVLPIVTLIPRPTETPRPPIIQRKIEESTTYEVTTREISALLSDMGQYYKAGFDIRIEDLLASLLFTNRTDARDILTRRVYFATTATRDAQGREEVTTNRSETYQLSVPTTESENGRFFLMDYADIAGQRRLTGLTILPFAGSDLPQPKLNEQQLRALAARRFYVLASVWEYKPPTQDRGFRAPGSLMADISSGTQRHQYAIWDDSQSSVSILPIKP